MSSFSDARTAAWISAWNCVQSAQKLRTEAMQHADQRLINGDESDASHYFSQATQGYNGLMEEARIYASLASVGDQLVGMSAGDWLLEHKREEERAQAARAEFMERMAQRKDEGTQDASDG